MVMKVIVRYGEAHAKDTHVIKLAHIDCVTETYDVLKASIAPPLNRCLNELKRSTINVYKNVDGVVAIQVGTREESICVDTIFYDYVSTINFRFFMTGDMSFYASCLGKIHMGGKWCTWCNLQISNWRNLDHERGVPWTLESMAQLRSRLDDNLIKDEPRYRCGVVAKPLFDCIEPNQYVFPILHSEIGLGNYFLNHFYNWIDYRVEDVPQLERDLRNERAREMETYDNYYELQWRQQWMLNGAVELTDVSGEPSL